jgi:sugar/nucleoside kinase (ribokinase family)
MPDVRDRIVVFGDVIDDVIATPSAAIRTDTDTPASIERRAGGSAANVASWLAQAGATVDFVGRVGVADLERHSRILMQSGVRPMLAADHDLPTGTIVIIVEGDQRTMLTERGANAALDPASVTDAVLARATAVHFTGYTLFGRSDLSGFGELIRRATAQGVPVSVDPGSAGFLVDFGVDRFLDAVAGASLIFPSLDEGRVLTGRVDPAEVAAQLAESFPLVALTLGAAGVVLAARGRTVLTIPAQAVTTIDPTGAGDAFCAGFLHTWIGTSDPVAAANAGAALAARAVSTIGGRPSA